MNSSKKPENEQMKMRFSPAEGGTLVVHLAGDWKIGEAIPDAQEFVQRTESESPIQRVTFETGELSGWDSRLLTFLGKVFALCASKGIEADKKSLPQGVKRLLTLASAVPERKGARKTGKRISFLARIGDSTLAFGSATLEMLNFVGSASIAFFNLLRGKAQFRRSDLFLTIQECGAQALPIVSLISLLVGLILAFVGAVQLMMFGAQIYVASLVGIAMVRVMGAIMTGIIMAGRTGASFAAQLGTMQVNEEIDALETMGISSMEFLVLPRMFALAIMMPLLCLYADLMGILGGLIVGVFMLDLSVPEYYNMTVGSVGLTNLFIGVFHSFVFGILIAVSGCMKGLQCGRSAAAVGQAVTSAVVVGIVSIIVSTAIITVMCNVLGI